MATVNKASHNIGKESIQKEKSIVAVNKSGIFSRYFLFRQKWIDSFSEGFIIGYIFKVQITVIFSFYLSRK